MTYIFAYSFPLGTQNSVVKLYSMTCDLLSPTPRVGSIGKEIKTYYNGPREDGQVRGSSCLFFPASKALLLYSDIEKVRCVAHRLVNDALYSHRIK